MKGVRFRGDSGNVSLRTRYLTASVTVVAVLVAGAVIANLYVARVTNQNTNTLQLRNSVAHASDEIRRHVLAAELSLSHMMVVPEAGREEDIETNFAKAHQLLNNLMSDPTVVDEEVRAALFLLSGRLEALHDEFAKIIKYRKDPLWVYPILATLSGPMLGANTEFLTTIETLVEDISDDGINESNLDLYQRLVHIRNLWRRLIMDYRAIMIRYAGLSESEEIPQEQNIENLFPIIRNEIIRLQGINAQRSDALLRDGTGVLLSQADKWFEIYRQLKKTRGSASWRQDVIYFDANIRRTLEKVNGALFGLDMAVGHLSSRNVRAVELAASQIIISFWVLSLFALLIIIATYLALERSVLKPVSRVAQALFSATGPDVKFLQLPAGESKEIQYLVQAFGTMHRQVRERQAALEFQALHDPLTHLPNRALLKDRIEHSIENAKRSGGKLALLLLDLDRFKDVNDTLGHHIGDKLLKKIAVRISGLVRATDTVARLGGDEFAILLELTETEYAQELGQRIAAELANVYHVDVHELYVGASIGIAFYPEDGQDSETLMRHADVAMYDAKRSNLNLVRYDEDHDEHTQDKLALIADLRSAIETDELQLYYQPKLAISSNSIVGFEALLRWHHPRHGMIMPVKTIELAENTGMIGNITTWVLRRALVEYSGLTKGQNNLHVAVNISPKTLVDPDFPQLVWKLLQETNVPPHALVLEITEGAVTSEHVLGNKMLASLSAMGVGISLDDFGSGMSSLRHLKMLPVAELKIDMSFVVNMLADTNDETIVKSTIDLGHNMDLRVVAEGVEDLKVFNKLKEMGCDIVQGFFIAPPMTLAEASECDDRRLTSKSVTGTQSIAI